VKPDLQLVQMAAPFDVHAVPVAAVPLPHEHVAVGAPQHSKGEQGAALHTVLLGFGTEMCARHLCEQLNFPHVGGGGGGAGWYLAHVLAHPFAALRPSPGLPCPPPHMNVVLLGSHTCFAGEPHPVGIPWT
jgi:hypothetical protein